MKPRDQINFWRPQYPESADERVRLEDSEYQSFVTDGKPGVIVQDYPLENPACFWIDYEHVYLRSSWTTWGTVSLSNPEQIVSICNAHFCRILHSVNNATRDLIVPVYRIEALPENLFSSEDILKSKSAGLVGSRNKDEYQDSLQFIAKITGELPGKVEVFSHVKMENDACSVVVSDDYHAIIMDLLPDDRNFVFTEPDDESGTSFVNKWPGDKISLRFIEKLRRMKKFLSEKEPTSTIDVGFIANTWTINALQKILNEKGITEFILFSYDNLREKLKEIYPQK